MYITPISEDQQKSNQNNEEQKQTREKEVELGG
jgi:hypothetical protein